MQQEHTRTLSICVGFAAEQAASGMDWCYVWLSCMWLQHCQLACSHKGEVHAVGESPFVTKVNSNASQAG